MAGHKRRIKHCSKKPVQRFNGDFEHNVLPQPLSQAALDILGVLGADGVAGEAARLANVVKSDVSYWVKRFIKAGALVLRESQDPSTLGKPKKAQRIGPGLPKYYDLTPYGSKLITGSDNQLRLPVVFEDMSVKFLVLRWERPGSIDWEKLGQPNNWNKFGFRVTGVHVVKTTKSVIIHPGPLKGFDVDALEVDSGRIVERVRYILEVQFGMQLSDECEFLHGPMWQVYRPEAREWIKAGSVKVSGVGALDESPKPWLKALNKVPHVEFNDKTHAAIAAAWPPIASDPRKRLATDAPLYPLYLEEVHRMVTGLVSQIEVLTSKVGSVKNFEGQVSEVMTEFRRLSCALAKLENLDKICDNLQKITEILSKLVDVEDNGNSQAVKGSGGKEYVS